MEKKGKKKEKLYECRLNVSKEIIIIRLRKRDFE
jgi:hypothetical protein